MSDDDIFAMFGSTDEEDDDDLFSSIAGAETSTDDDFFDAFDAPATSTESTDEMFEGFDDPPPTSASADTDERPDWLTDDFSFEDLEDSPDEQRGGTGGFMVDGGPLAGLASEGFYMGLSPQQRMVLAIFLFVDVLILGCGLLLVVGAIRPF